MIGTTTYKRPKTGVPPIATIANNYRRARRPWLGRLWSKINSHNEDPHKCWEWRGYIAPDGQPKLKWGASYKSAHRLIYEIRVGEIGRKHLRWTCPTDGCMNPNHMTLGGNKRESATPVADTIREDAHLFALVGFNRAQLARLLAVSPKTVQRALEKSPWMK